MRISIIAVLFSFVTLPGSFAQQVEKPSAVAAPQADEQKLRDLEASLLKVENDNSKDLCASLLSADFRGLTPDGRTFDKPEVLQDMSDRAMMHFAYRVEHSGMHIFQFGDTAVVTYTKEYMERKGRSRVSCASRASSMS